MGAVPKVSEMPLKDGELSRVARGIPVDAMRPLAVEGLGVTLVEAGRIYHDCNEKAHMTTVEYLEHWRNQQCLRNQRRLLIEIMDWARSKGWVGLEAYQFLFEAQLTRYEKPCKCDICRSRAAKPAPNIQRDQHTPNIQRHQHAPNVQCHQHAPNVQCHQHAPNIQRHQHAQESEPKTVHTVDQSAAQDGAAQNAACSCQQLSALKGLAQMSEHKEVLGSSNRAPDPGMIESSLPAQNIEPQAQIVLGETIRHTLGLQQLEYSRTAPLPRQSESNNVNANLKHEEGAQFLPKRKRRVSEKENDFAQNSEKRPIDSKPKLSVNTKKSLSRPAGEYHSLERGSRSKRWKEDQSVSAPATPDTTLIKKCSFPGSHSDSILTDLTMRMRRLDVRSNSVQENTKYKLFITYAKDNKEHLGRVLQMVKYLRRNQFTIAIDMNELDLIAKDKMGWIGSRFNGADKIIAVISPEYFRIIGGEEVSWKTDFAPTADFSPEGLNTRYINRLMQTEFLNNGSTNQRVMPVIFPGADWCHVPHWLQNTLIYTWPDQHRAIVKHAKGCFQYDPVVGF